jgi:hypothetical protein
MTERDHPDTRHNQAENMTMYSKASPECRLSQYFVDFILVFGF